MKKSVLQTILEMANGTQSAGLQSWIRHNTESLIKQERAQIAEAWREGNREGWGMISDDPLDGDRYYDETFNSTERT